MKRLRQSRRVQFLSTWAAWHLPGGPVGPPARWAATSNVEGGSGTEEGIQGPLASTFAGALEFQVTLLRMGLVFLISQGRFEEPARPCLRSYC